MARRAPGVARLVVVSIDAAAFNARPIVGGLRGENDARALLMLAHRDLWRGWEAAEEPAVPRVDLRLAELSAANPALDLARTFEIAPVFDQVPEGVVALRSLRLGPAGSPR